jgi:hypothetical protein
MIVSATSSVEEVQSVLSNLLSYSTYVPLVFIEDDTHPTCSCERTGLF